LDLSCQEQVSGFSKTGSGRRFEPQQRLFYLWNGQVVFAVGTNGIDPSRVTVTALDTPYWAVAPVYYSATFVVLVRVPASKILHVPFMSCHAMRCEGGWK
jgi:hypothetical protein